jgi:hypothetical protein
MKKIELLHFTVAKKIECQLLGSHLLESSLARINWIRAVDKFCVEQLICCQKCRANDCRAIEFRAVHPHSFRSVKLKLIIEIKNWENIGHKFICILHAKIVIT